MRSFESARSFQVLLATFALTLLAVAPAAAQSPDNPVCDSDAPNLWKRDTQFLEVWWNDARPVHIAECLEAGADPEADGILRHAAEWSRFPAVVQMLLEAGANPNPIGGVESPLYWAVQRTDNVTVVRGVVAALLYADADLGPDRFGYTPLYHVLGNQPNSVALVELLLEGGADPNGSWGPVTPLHHAAQNTTNPRVLEALLAVGADPNAKTTLGTPLHIAIDRCRQLLVRALLEYGADPNARRGLDQTPLEVAESCSNASERDNIVRMLREAGATSP
ncbi:MAG: ankyrin repeat domain-containing protein [Gemmatimonadota bacterium]|nr:ankyrin repeat domain-containing protein [Gemmatimonadota bacterium]